MSAEAFLSAALRGTWIPVGAVAWAVAADLLELWPPQVLSVYVAPLACLACSIRCVGRMREGAVLPGLVSCAICLYAGLVAFLVGGAALFG